MLLKHVDIWLPNVICDSFTTFFVHVEPSIIILIKCHLNEIIKDASHTPLRITRSIFRSHLTTNNVSMLQKDVKYDLIPCILLGDKAIYDIHIE